MTSWTYMGAVGWRTLVFQDIWVLKGGGGSQDGINKSFVDVIYVCPFQSVFCFVKIYHYLLLLKLNNQSMTKMKA